MLILYSGLILVMACGVSGFFVLLLSMCFIVVTIQGESMAPTLHEGEQVLVCRCWPRGLLRKGMIVLVLPWARPSSTFAQRLRMGPYLKRITAVGGETATIARTPDHASFFALSQHAESEQQTWHIPQKHIFVCGDNRLGSVDSRIWGPLPVECVLGVMLLRVSRA
jgi:signal peptidase I